jgi:dihydrofolate reductase
LPGRTNLVLTRAENYGAAGCRVLASPEEALDAVEASEEAVVIGGRDIYAAFLSRANRLYMTVVHTDAEGDTFLPPIQFASWQIESSEVRSKDEKNDHAHTFFVLTRRPLVEPSEQETLTRLPERFCSPKTTLAGGPEI